MEISLMPQPEFVSGHPKFNSPCSSNKKLTGWVSLALSDYNFLFVHGPKCVKFKI